MSKLSARTRRLALASALTLGVAACGDGGTGPEVIAPEQIAGDFRVCELVFIPDGGVPDTVNVLARLDTVVSPPRLEIGANPAQRPFSFLYRVTRDGGTTQSIAGSYVTGPRDVQLAFGTTPAARRLLLPERMNLEYTDNRVLTVLQTQASYTINKSDYEALKGQTFAAIRDQFPGRMSARFVRWGTPCS